MPGVQTHQTTTKRSSELASSTTKLRAPLRALQMLTQSVSTREYVQPISDASEHQKKSPLALLAATCSSIGKTEAKQDSRGHSPKISSTQNSASPDASSRSKVSEDAKSSFKPYLNDEKDATLKPSNSGSSTSIDKPGFRAPSKELVPNDSLSKSPEYRSKVGHGVPYVTPFQYPYYASDPAQCFYQAQNRMCGMYYDLAHQPHHSCLKSDCLGNCGSVMPPPPSSLATPTTTPSLRAIFPSTSQPSLVKSHGLPSSTGSRSNPLYPRCNCGYCNQTMPSPNDTTASMKGIQHPSFASYHRDYLQSATNCQDPYCTNCKSHIVTAGASTPSSPRGCGPQCFHHHHDPGSVLPTALFPTMSHMYPYGFMLRSQSDQANQFVCNWVQDSKNCGKNFPTSDELLQHLRTHTNSSSSVPIHTPCNIPGCPCGLKTAVSAPPRLHSSRYHPYFLPSPTGLHSSAYHSAITPYVSPHAMPYASPFKPY